MKHVLELIEQERYKDAAALAVYREVTYEVRDAFVQCDVSKTKAIEHYDAYEMLLLADARTDFDCYCRFMDYRQPIQRNFYLDRQHYLKDIADAVTNMYYPKKPEDEIDTIRIKLRTRSGKSEFFNRAAFWVQSTIGSGESLHAVGGGKLKEQIHEKRVQYIDEYWDRHLIVFPEMNENPKVTGKQEAMVFLEPSEYADITTVTVGGSIEGHVQVTNMLILDDLVSSNEINSVMRMDAIYDSDINNAITRRIASDAIKRVLIGTPIPTLTGKDEPLDRYYDDRVAAGDNCLVFSVPALDANDESNYAYRDFRRDPVNPRWTFTSEYFRRERKAAYSSENEVTIATWNVLNQMNKMQLGDMMFSKIKYYDPETETPKGQYKELTLFDPADTGADSATCIHARVYNDDKNHLYIHDIFRSKKPLVRGNKGGFLDELVDFFIKNDINSFEYEANMGGDLLGETLIEIGREKSHRLSYGNFKQSKNKEQRIRDNSEALLEHVKMRSDKPHKSYDEAEEEIRGWTEHSKHDDAIDTLTMIVERFFVEPNKKNDFYVGRIM